MILMFAGSARTRCLRLSLRPEARDARAGEGVTIAYPVAGDGPVTMAVVSPLTGQLELAGEEPAPEHVWSRFAACARVALSDRRGRDGRIVRRRVSASIVPPWPWMSRRCRTLVIPARRCCPG
jgi:hypothetical protein